MIRKRRDHALLGKACGLGLCLLVFASCADNGIPLRDLRGRIQGGSKRTAELVYETRNNVVALADNRRGALYAATSIGDVYKITDVNKGERIYRGLSGCEDNWTGLAIDRDGGLAANRCRDGRNTIVSISDSGEVKDLFPVPGRVVSMTSDSKGGIYIGTWTSEGNVSISLNPRSLAGAEFINGKIYVRQPGDPLAQLYDGAIPVCLGVSERDAFYASLWGQRGYFAPEKKTFGYVDPYRAYWLELSDKVRLVNFTDGKTRFDNSLIDSLSLFVIPDDDYLFGYGISKEGVGGFYLVEENRPPIRLLFQDQKYDKNVTALTLHNGVVYFGNVEGNIYRIK
ncbi:MAG: hypothetical protein JXD23_06240 [Spirochaetales bacterium]|nr:hypothetical protein [Spirochaetales bacterium]